MFSMGNEDYRVWCNENLVNKEWVRQTFHFEKL